jgi:hypothetical protein
MRTELTLTTWSEVLQSVADFQELPNKITQLDQRQTASLTQFWERLYGGNYQVMQQDYATWQVPDIHVIKQTWGSTAKGWGGMGGAAMTTDYTTVLVNRHVAAVYYDGRLAYIAENDMKLQAFVNLTYRRLPGIPDCERELTIVYKKMR